MLEAVARHDVIYTVVHNAVFTPGTLHAIALLQGDELPEPQVGRAKSIFPMTEAHHRASPARIWRASKAAGRWLYRRYGVPRDIFARNLDVRAGALRRGAGADALFRHRRRRCSALTPRTRKRAVSTVSTSWGMVGGGAGELGNLCEVHTRGDCLRVVGRGRELHRFSRERALGPRFRSTSQSATALATLAISPPRSPP